MRDLKKSDRGRAFTAKIKGKICKGKIQCNNNASVFWLCQNDANGALCEDRFGFNFSWTVGNGSVESCCSSEVSDLTILSFTKEVIESYKDFQVGDVLVSETSPYKKVVDARFGDSLITRAIITEDMDYAHLYSCNELYNAGYRLKVEPEEESVPVEMSVAEVATKLGLDPKTLKIVDK